MIHFKETLEKLFTHHRLSREEAKNILLQITENQYPDAQVVAFMTVFLMRPISAEELAGFREAMQERSIKPKLTAQEAIDLCGTGGDGKNTFNISTLASFVVAACGKTVVKHGNYGVSSVSGSSTVLAHFGVKFSNDDTVLNRSLERSGICFLHAPLFHPALKNVGHLRQALGIKTFFNMLGPLVNPAMPSHQLTGVFSLELARIYTYILQDTDTNFTILHALDGYDECSLTASCKRYSSQKEEVFSAEIFGIEPLKSEEIFGGDTKEEAAKIFEKVLRNEATQAQKAVVAANAALALQTVNQDVELENHFQNAMMHIENGKALACFEQFLHCNA
ncbi:MAG: anthranilate phosphoribosyltransferase [Bernardetiaceae bacterium]|nr:anthranilate phosphoribosyltransferase [Bernardetiaceae bacterium]